MWGTAIVMFGAAKWISWIHRKPSSAPAWKHVTYLLLWPGMDVNGFLNVRPTSQPAIIEWGFGFLKFGLGLGVLLIIVPVLGGANEYLIGWLGMLGIVLALHFGLFHILSCAFRHLGLAAIPIMNWPIVSRSLTEFWSKRWNLAFRDLAHRFVFRPLVGFLGPTGALMMGFLISGLLHDIVISVPAGGGFGLPTCYFAIQGEAILTERSGWGRAIGLGKGLAGRAFCLVVLLRLVRCYSTNHLYVA